MECLQRVSVQAETNSAFIQPTSTRNQLFTEYQVYGNSKLRIVVAPPKGLTSRAAAGAQSPLANPMFSPQPSHLGQKRFSAFGFVGANQPTGLIAIVRSSCVTHPVI
jgi:hypothetical protein